ncbi:DUF4054 domain-containing protein [Entomomonas asaccharolytica]|uniref:DUF4054 domain-containing protein n=1 Tax=Entomomonas asaccharolytica TaxID=2785331 RepID=A0A974NHX6_9GAMM|nr:DUF4054 domain-containing protein [Entomomonas asaccharolytica]QQP86939.1 DUF4054 domain-containing protein [Entomomonas asaccharolytica]
MLLDDFRARYPEFDSISDGRINVFIEDAQLQVSAKIWGKLYQQGVLALAAHLLKSNPNANGSGSGGNGSPFPVSNKSAGSLSIGYAVPTVSDNDDSSYMLTIYGQRYLQLRKLVAVHIKVIAWPPR